MRPFRVLAGGWIDFIRRERLYGLVFILTLCVFAFAQIHSSSSVDTADSASVQQLTQASQELEKSLHDISGWIKIIEKRPAAVLFCGVMLLIFFSLFFVGIFILILAKMIPRISNWFQNSAAEYSGESLGDPVIFFRVLILAFAWIVASGTLLNQIWGERTDNENWIGLSHTLSLDLFVCFAIFALFHAQKNAARFLGDVRVSLIQELKRGVASYTATFPIFVTGLLVAVGVAEWFHYEPPVHPLVKILVEEESRSQFVFQFALVLAAFLAPIMEEIFFRGFCYRLFRGWWGIPAASGISAALFAGVHGSGFAFFPIFILGVALAWIYEKRGHLAACWTFHILHNILFTTYFFSIKSLLGTSL